MLKDNKVLFIYIKEDMHSNELNDQDTEKHNSDVPITQKFMPFDKRPKIIQSHTFGFIILY